MKTIKNFFGLADYEFHYSVVAFMVCFAAALPKTVVNSAIVWGICALVNLLFPIVGIPPVWLIFSVCLNVNMIAKSKAILQIDDSGPFRFACFGLFRKSVSPEEYAEFQKNN